MKPKNYIPSRRDVVWLDFDPTKGKEIGKYRPMLILSSKDYAQKTGLIICCPISISIRGTATEVPINCLENPSVVATSIVNTLDFHHRKIKLIDSVSQAVFDDILARFTPLLGAS